MTRPYTCLLSLMLVTAVPPGCDATLSKGPAAELASDGGPATGADGGLAPRPWTPPGAEAGASPAADAAVVTEAGPQALPPRGPQPYPLPGSNPLGQLLHVALTGDDSNPGTAASPWRTVSKAAQQAQAGDLVIVHQGTYQGDVTVQHAGTASKPIVFMAEAVGQAVIEGHVAPAGFDQNGDGNSTKAPHVTWRGFVIRNQADGLGDASNDCWSYVWAVGTARGWLVRDTVVEGGQGGVRLLGDNAALENVLIQDLARYAWDGGGVSGLVVRNSIIRRINQQGMMQPACGAVTKLLYTDGMLYENNESYDNVGPGFWLDWDNKNYVIRHSEFHHNRGRTYDWEGPGVWIEGNPASNGKVHDNEFHHNKGCGLGILETVGVEVYNNKFHDNACAVQLRNLKRDPGTSRRVRDVSVHDNRFEPGGAAIQTSVGDWDGYAYPPDKNILADRNVYAVPAGTTLVNWLGKGFADLSKLPAALGWEQNGSQP